MSTDYKGRTAHIDIRLTPEEKQLIEEKAAECGLTYSDFGRRVLLGYHPKHRLTEKEADAILTLRIARKDLQRIYNLINTRSAETKRQLFRNPVLLQAWIESIDMLRRRWSDIIESLSQK